MSVLKSRRGWVDVVAGIALAGVLSSGVMAIQPSDPAKPAKPAEPPKPAEPAKPGETPSKEGGPDGGLGGPKVTEAKAATLVVRDMSGRVQRLEVPPAEAALKFLGLSEEQKAKIDVVLAERATIMDSIVRDHLKEVVQLAGLGQSGVKPGGAAPQIDGKPDADAAKVRTEYRELMQGLIAAAEPLRKRGVLGQELQPILNTEQKALLRQLNEEYMQARISDEVEAAKARGEVLRPQQVLTTESLTFVGNEIKRAYERVVGQKSKDFEALIAALGLSPEQEGTIRKVAGDSFVTNYGKQSPMEKARVFGEVYRVLTAGQREILAGLMGGGKVEKDGGK